MSNKASIGLEIDLGPHQKALQERLHKEFQEVAKLRIEAFFAVRNDYSQGYNKPPVKVIGEGCQMIEDFIIEKFADPKTKERMEKYFDDNFERIMQDSMEKALYHKARGIAFNKTKQIPNTKTD